MGFEFLQKDVWRNFKKLSYPLEGSVEGIEITHYVRNKEDGQRRVVLIASHLKPEVRRETKDWEPSVQPTGSDFIAKSLLYTCGIRDVGPEDSWLDRGK